MVDALLEGLPRTAETELMSAAERAYAYAHADFDEPHSAFIEQFAQRFGQFRSGHVLDVGCGPGDITVRFAHRYPAAVITAIEGAQVMVELAKNRIEAEALGPRVSVEHLYLPDPGLFRRSFDALISNSLLHHLADPLTLWEIVAALPKGAPVWVVDLMRPTDRNMLNELVARHTENADPLLVEDFGNSLHAAYRPAEIAAQLRAKQLAHLNIEATSDRHVAVWGWR